MQGVGFRPFVWRLAHAERLGGWVRNDEHGVLLEVEGPDAAVERFLARLAAEAPPLAAVERVRSRRVAARGERAFAIVESERRGGSAPPVAPDTATCAACLAELFDPADRRFRYPFINCTDCGPRFTIVRDVPYDRAFTTMAGFAMCAACRAEYENPADRRFHAEPNACPDCGPRARLVGGGPRRGPTAAPPPRPGGGRRGAAPRRRDPRRQGDRRLPPRVPRRRRGGRRAAARAQAPRGPAVRADGRGPAAARRPLRARARAADGARPADRDRRPAAGRGGRAVGGAGHARAGRHAPLLAAPPSAAARRRACRW